jgi:CBS domain-containing protein
MDDTRAHKLVQGELEGESRRRYMFALLQELQAMERMVNEGLFERGVSRIGAEQELFLVDAAYHPTKGALKLIEALNDPHYTTELALFNLEANADALPFSGDSLSKMEAQLKHLVDRVRVVGAPMGVRPILAGILPTIDKSDLGLDNMVPNPRYQTLSGAMKTARGQAFDFSINGIDELNMRHDNVMVEACNASFQVHLQLAEPERFAHFYNLAQMLAAPVLAVSANSSVLFNRRLWSETRIALFEQSCDVRTPGLHLRDAMGRVSFGRQWLNGSVVDVFRENVSRFRPLVGAFLGKEDDAFAALDEKRPPTMKALRTHNGTIYRWNRACYGISDNGQPHLRIELRVLPSGPTVADEVANAALWLGLMHELGNTTDDITKRIAFSAARQNLYSAARDGMRARLTWLDGEVVLAQSLLLETLLPLAKAGLDRAGIAAQDSERYLGILEKRGRALRTGASWTVQSLDAMADKGSPGSRATAATAGMFARQVTNTPVSEWDLARLDERETVNDEFQKVSQLMITDIYTVSPDDPIALVAEMMAWERARYVPVEDDRGRLVGLTTQRHVMRHLAKAGTDPSAHGASVSAIMIKELVTVTPDTPTRDAVALMRKHRIGALPVVQGDHIVAMLTEEEFVGFADRVLHTEPPMTAPPSTVPPSTVPPTTMPPRSGEPSASVIPSGASGTPRFVGRTITDRVIGRVVGAQPGATVIVVAGIHGNEPAGIEAGERVLAALNTGRIEFRGELVVLAGNLAAMRSGERYLQRDLNRGWTTDRLARLRTGGPQDAEDAEQAELLRAFEDAEKRARGPMHLADLHTSSADGVPFVLFRDSPAQRAFVNVFPIPVISGIVEKVEGVLSEHACGRGYTAFSVEGGQHDAPESRDNLEAVMWLMIHRAGLIDAIEQVERARPVLERMRGDLPRAIEVVSRYAITPAHEFVMKPGFRNIDRVKKGEVLARDLRGEVRAPADGVLVLPLYQKLGNDGFFWGREVP